MGSVRPARRFDALRVVAKPVLPCRPKPDGGPPCAWAPLQRSTAAPPRRPARPRTGSADDASSLGLSCPTAHPERRTRSPHGLPAARRAACGVWVPPARRPPPSLPARRSAGAPSGFSLRGLLLAAIGDPPGRPALLPFLAPVRNAREGVRTRAAPGLRSRCRARSSRHPEGRADVDASLGFSPPERSPPPSRPALSSRGLPSRAPRAVRSVPRAPQGLSDREDRHGPSRERRLSWGLAPRDRHGAAKERAEGWLMVSPRGRRSLHRRRPLLTLFDTSPTRVRPPARRRRLSVHG